MADHPANETTLVDTQEALTCVMCLDVFREPTLLPCSHTFCLRCLKDLVDHAVQESETDAAVESKLAQHLDTSSVDEATKDETLVEGATCLQEDKSLGPSCKKSFKCPSCRREIEIPEDRVKAFRINIDIDQNALDRARDDSHCKEHNRRDNDIFCVDCDMVICKKCKIKNHLHHRSQSIEDAAMDARIKLSKEQIRVQAVHDDLIKIVDEIKQENYEYEVKKEIVKREINQRYSRIVVEAQRFREEALAAVEACDMEVGQRLKQDLNDVRQNLREVRYLCERIEKAESTDDPCKLVKISMEMTSGSGSEAAMKKLVAVGHVTESRRPAHRSKLPDDDAIFKTIQFFIGTCEIVRLQREVEQEPNLQVKEEFRCGDHDDVTVFCVKTEPTGVVNISFDPFYNDQKPLAKLYHNKLKSLSLSTDCNNIAQIGRVSYSVREKRLRYRECFGWSPSLYSKAVREKSCWVLFQDRFLRSVGESTMFSDSESNHKQLFTFRSKLCRAIDVDVGEQYFVVVEEGRIPATQRRVMLYKRPHTSKTVTAVNSYTSPITPFLPADVCFYTLLRQQVLLIADETNDALHVAEVKDDRVTFTRFLCPGCPLLLQPTALNTDHEGRLWVGCRGGRILTFWSAEEDDVYRGVQSVRVLFDPTD